MPTWRCAPWAPSRSERDCIATPSGNGWQHAGTVKALLVVSLLVAACTPEQAAAPPPTAQRLAADGDAVGRHGAGRSLAHGAGRRRQQQPGLRQRHRHHARTLAGEGRARHPRATSDPGANRRCRLATAAQRVERAAHRRRRGLPRLHDQPWRRERLLPEARPAARSARRRSTGARRRLRRAADRGRGVGLPQRRPSSTPGRAGPTASSSRRPPPTGRASAAAPTTTTPITTSASCSSSTGPRPGSTRAGDARLRRDARAQARRPPPVAAAALRRRSGRRPPAPGALVGARLQCAHASSRASEGPACLKALAALGMTPSLNRRSPR